jgi:hypothetical protein
LDRIRCGLQLLMVWIGSIYAIDERRSVVVLEGDARSWFPERCEPRLEEFGFWFPRIVVS